MAEEVHRKRRTHRLGKEEVLESSRNMFSMPQANEPKGKQVSAAAKLLNPAFGDHYSRKPLGDDGKRVSSRPMRMLIAEEMEKEIECGCRSPSIIARLMGLDTLPAEQVNVKQKRRAAETVYQSSSFDKQQNQPDALLHTYERYPDDRILDNIHPSHMHAMEHQELKDVFEVEETSKTHKQHYFGHHGSKRSSKLPQADMGFVRQKLVDGKHLSTDEKPWRSKEFHDVLDDLDSNKDPFLRVHHEPHSLLTKHLHNLQTRSSPTLLPNHITVLRSRTRMELEISDNYSNGGIYWKSEQKTEGRINMQKGGGGCPLNHNVAQFFCGGSPVYPLHRPCQLQSLKSDNHLMATEIVVLKPSHQRTQPEAKAFPSECTCTNHRMHRFRRSSRQDLFEEAIDWQRLSRNSSGINEGSVRPEPRGSREIARAVTRRLRQSVHRSSSIPSMVSRDFIRDEHSYHLLKEGSIYDSGTSAHCKWPHELGGRFKSSPSYLLESPANMEAKKHLSDRWKIIQCNGEGGHHGGNSNTLGEMLGLPEPNNDRPSLTLGEVIGQNNCKYSSVGEEGLIGCGCNAEGSNWRFDQDTHAKSIRRPRSGTVFTDGCKHLKAAGGLGSVDDVANDLIAREVISPSPEWSFSSRRQPDLEEKPFTKNWKLVGCDVSPSKSIKPIDNHLLSARKCSRSHNSSSLDGAGSAVGKQLLPDNCSVSNLTQDATQLKESVSVHESCSEAASDHHGTVVFPDLDPYDHATVLKNGCGRAVPLDPDNRIDEVSSSDHCVTSPRSCVSQSRPDGAAVHGALQKDTTEQPSPVSILEPPFEEEFFSSECFEKISAGLDGLRKQLRLLRMQTLENVADDSDCESSVSEGLLHSCRSNSDEAVSKEEENTLEETMEFSFLRDMLMISGFDREHNILSNTWYSPDRPLNPSLFDQLDKKYGEQEKLYTEAAKNAKSPRSERRLLFDRMNEGLAEILRPSMGMYPWSKATVRSRMPQKCVGRRLREQLWELIQTDMTIQISETEDDEEFMETMVRKGLAEHGEWFELEEHIEMIGSEIERALISELTVEIAVGLRVW